MMVMTVMVVVMVALMMPPQLVLGMVHEYGGEKLPGNEISWLLLGMYNGSTVDVNFTLTRSEAMDRGHLELLWLHEEDLVYVGIHTPYNIWLCCDEDVHEGLQGDSNSNSPAMYNACGAKDVGYTALTSSATKHIGYDLVAFEKGILRKRLDRRYSVEREGLFYLILVNCNGSGVGEVEITGTATMRSPLGYLQGSDYYYVPLYGALAICYAAVFMGWTTLLWLRRTRFMLLHHGGLAMLFLLGALDYMFTAFDLSARNENGYLCFACTVVAVFFSAAFATLVRVFVLLVALGLGVIGPMSGGFDSPRAKYAIAALSVGYFGFSFVQNIVGNLTDIPDSSGRKALLLLLPLNILNSCFYVWTFLELIRSVHHARDDGDRDKFNQFLSHLIMFLSLTGMALFFAIVQMIVQWRNVSDVTWTFQWVFGGAWDAVVMVVLIIFALMWMPSQFTHALLYRERGPLEWRRAGGGVVGGAGVGVDGGVDAAPLVNNNNE